MDMTVLNSCSILQSDDNGHRNCNVVSWTDQTATSGSHSEMKRLLAFQSVPFPTLFPNHNGGHPWEVELF